VLLLLLLMSSSKLAPPFLSPLAAVTTFTQVSELPTAVVLRTSSSLLLQLFTAISSLISPSPFGCYTLLLVAAAVLLLAASVVLCTLMTPRLNPGPRQDR
jgi:hypothetical protein